MNREALYHKTVGILFDAYFNDTLEHGNCCACAVGNIVAANCGYKVYKTIALKSLDWPLRDEAQFAYPFEFNRSVVRSSDGRGLTVRAIPRPRSGKGWSSMFFTSSKTQEINESNESALRQIKSTGYEVWEVMAIEYAFETAEKGNNEEDYMFNGLVAVLEVLKQIHDVKDDEEVTKKFKAQYDEIQNKRNCRATV